MKRSRLSRRLRIAIGITAVLALGAAVSGIQRASVAQSEPVISLNAPVSFPVDI